MLEFLQSLAKGVLATLIVLILAFPVRRFHARRLKVKRERDNKRKAHFKELSAEARQIMSEAPNLSEWCGEIVVRKPGYVIHGPDLAGIAFPRFSTEFAAHFSQEAGEWARYDARVVKHNNDYGELCLTVKHEFESRGIRMISKSDLPSVGPCIYDSIFDPLFSWWGQRAQKKPDSWLNFKEFETRPDREAYELFVPTWYSSPIAYARTNSERQKCKDAIRSVAENREYEKKATEIMNSAERLLGEIQTFKKRLADRLDDVDRYWPGTKSYKFKEMVKSCPKCKEIFG